jgi:uncharacterized membrane protein
MNNRKGINVRKLAIIGVLGAISTVLGMTPLGFIPVGPTRATIMHIPVIIGAIMEGPVVGGFVGLIFGLFSIFQAITNPTPVSFVFLNPLVSIVPRVLIGIVSYYVYDFFKKMGNKKTKGFLFILWAGIIFYLGFGIYKNIIAAGSIWINLMNIGLLVLSLVLAYLSLFKYKNVSLDLMISSIVGTLTNTVGVLTITYIIYAERFVNALGQNPEAARKVIVGVGIANGIPETIIAIIIVTCVVNALKRGKRE